MVFISHSPQTLKTIRSLTYRDPNSGFVAGAERYAATETRWYDFARIDANITDNLRFSSSYTYNPIVPGQTASTRFPVSFRLPFPRWTSDRQSAFCVVPHSSRRRVVARTLRISPVN